jgi:AraC family transcriptional regulator
MQHILDTGNYFGKLLSKKHFPKAILSETAYFPHSTIPVHCHKNFYISYVLKGKYSETYLKTKIFCLQGDIIIHPQHLEHSNGFDDKGGTCFNIEFSNSFQKEIDILNINNFKLFDSKSILLKTAIQRIYNEYKSGDEYSAIIIEGLLLETMGYSARETYKNISQYWMKKANEIIKDTRSSNISLSSIATELNISTSHLAREFKKACGVTIGQYIQNIKIQQACEKLKKNNSDILSIALDSGFSDQSHFTKSFKKITGLTPRQYQLINN